MGVERSVTRWFVLRQFILTEIARLEAQLSQEAAQQAAPAEEMVTATQLANRQDELHQQLARAQERLHFLGPCPKPMMG